MAASTDKMRFGRLGKAFASSAIIRSLIRFYNKAIFSSKSGPEDKPSTAYGKLNRSFRDSRILSGTRRIGRTDAARGERTESDASLAERLRRTFLSGRLVSPLNRAMTGILYLKTTMLGVMLMSAGIYTCIVWLIKYFTDLTTAPYSELTAGVICFLVSPLFFSKKTVGSFILSKKLFRFIAVDLLGANVKTLGADKPAGGTVGLFVIVGMLTGILTFFVSPYQIILITLILILLAVIFRMPEAGIVTVIVSLVFFGQTYSVLFVSVTCMAYLFKLVKRKRYFRIEALDVAVAAFFVLMLASSLGTEGYELEKCINTALFILGYFLCRNLVSSATELERVMNLLAVSSVIVSSVTVFAFIFGGISDILGDGSIFMAMDSSVHVFFSRPEDSAAFITMTLPFLMLKLPECRAGQRFVYLLSTLICVYAVAINASAGSLIAIAISFLVVFVLYRWDTFASAVLCFIPFLFMLSFLPDAILKLNAEAISDPAKWNIRAAALNMILKHPEGLGFGSFRDAYALYSTEAYPFAADASSQFLQIAIEAGVAALIMLIAVIVLFFMMNRTYLHTSLMTKSKNLVYAPIGAVIAATVNMAFNSTGDDGRIMLLLFCIIGIGAAAVDLGKNETENRYGSGYTFTDFEYTYQSESMKEAQEK